MGWGGGRPRVELPIEIRLLRSQAQGQRILFTLLSVVKSELCDFKIGRRNSVNHTMFIRDTSRPEACKCVLQRFWFPDPLIMTSHSGLNQFVDSSDYFFIRLQPVLVIFPSLGRENKIHVSMRSLAFFVNVFPEFRLSIEASKRVALAGDRSR